jgi:uncharacterized protein YeaO (DUF488 family)
MDTSYFANLRRVEVPLSICGKAPEWYAGPQFKLLAPKWTFFSAYKSGEIDENGYTEHFKKEVLDNLDPQIVYNLIVNQYSEKVSLLCYEKPGDFCHRRLVAEWFEEKLNICVPERINYDLNPFLSY